jgi:hypothetical protein
MSRASRAFNGPRRPPPGYATPGALCRAFGLRPFQAREVITYAPAPGRWANGLPLVNVRRFETALAGDLPETRAAVWYNRGAQEKGPPGHHPGGPRSPSKELARARGTHR